MVMSRPIEFYPAKSTDAGENDLGSFFDIAPGGPGDYTVSIDWGDGSSSAGSLMQNDDGSFEILGDHSYANTGDFTVAVSVARSDGQTLSASGEAHVMDQLIEPIDWVGPIGAAYPGGVLDSMMPISAIEAVSPTLTAFTPQPKGPTVAAKPTAAPSPAPASKSPAIVFSRNSPTIGDLLFAPDRKTGLLDDGVGNLLA